MGSNDSIANSVGRTQVATLFPNEVSLLRLVSAMAAEVNEEWETGPTYRNPESE
jgi:transposase-like protein